jgi:AcrR family transcriptional regulator
MGHGPSTSGLHADRRLIRGDRTRTAIVEAMIDLIEAGNTHPTARQVAEQARVSVRSVFHHFEDVDGLFLSAARLHASRHRSLIVTIPPHGPVEPRIRATCHHRRQLFEAVAPVHRVAYARTDGSPGLRELLADHRSLLRRQLAVTLEPELRSRGAGAPYLLEALDVTTGWEAWHALRYHTRHSASSAERVTVYAVTRLLR